MSLRIALHLSVAHTERAYLRAVSGHVQVPLMTARLLHERGHEVTLLTTHPKPDHALPDIVPPGVRVVGLPEASRTWPARGYHPGRAAAHLLQLQWHLRCGSYDLVHFWGFRSSAALAGLSRLGGFLPPTVASLGGVVSRGSAVDAPLRSLLRRLDGVFTFTPWVASELARWTGRSIPVTRPGTVKKLETGASAVPKDTVLFWRNANHSNGADLAAVAFGALADRYPDVHFCFAVRPHDRLEGLLAARAAAHPNVHLHVYPYEEGASLEQLVARSICCVFPFRKLSINPQFSVLETLHAGCPAVVSDVESNPDLVRHGETGLVVPDGDAEALAGAIATLLDDRERAAKMGESARAITGRDWSWERYGEALREAYEDTVSVRV